MAKSQKNQTFVLKINTGYLSRHNWNLTLKLSEIRKQSQLVVSLGSSQVLRWMEKKGNDETATRLKKEIKEKKKLGNSAENKQKISELYDQLYITQFQQDYIMLVMDSPKDYRYACDNGFQITIDYGIALDETGSTRRTVKYKRFLFNYSVKYSINFIDFQKTRTKYYEREKEYSSLCFWQGEKSRYFSSCLHFVG